MLPGAPQGVLTYLKQFYYDIALSANPYTLRSLQELVDASHILFAAITHLPPRLSQALPRTASKTTMALTSKHEKLSHEKAPSRFSHASLVKIWEFHLNLNPLCQKIDELQSIQVDSPTASLMKLEGHRLWDQVVSGYSRNNGYS